MASRYFPITEKQFKEIKRSYAQSRPKSTNILKETIQRLEATPDVPSRLSKHPYFIERAKQMFPGVDSWMNPKVSPKKVKLSSPK